MSDNLQKNVKAHPIVALGRQFGCGGRETGKRIAGRLNARYFDKTLLSEAAESLGFDREIFRQADEKRPSWLRSLLQYSYGIETATGEVSDVDNEGLYNIQSRVIHQLADNSSCVFVGRTADYILREHPRILTIFLHAPLEVRCRNIVARKDTDSLEKAHALARKMDNARQSYYSYYTNMRWGEADTYHLSIDTSRFSPEEIAEMVLRYFEKH